MTSFIDLFIDIDDTLSDCPALEASIYKYLVMTLWTVIHKVFFFNVSISLLISFVSSVALTQLFGCSTKLFLLNQSLF